MKGVMEVSKAILVTTAVYGWLAVQTVREVQHALTRYAREKYAQRPIDF